MVEFFFISKC